MSLETNSYKELQMWEIITRLKKLGGDDLDSIVSRGTQSMRDAVDVFLGSVDNPYKKRSKVDYRGFMERCYQDNPRSQIILDNAYTSLQGLGAAQGASVFGAALGCSPARLGWQ